MSVSEVFIRKPVATTLLTIALALAGVIAFRLLPVAPLPQVEFPTIQVQASLPGASPETMASSVATPLERQFGRIANLTELTSTSYLGATSIVLQFDLNRNIDAAARDVQAAINAAAGQLPTTLPSKPTYRKVNPADAPIMILGLTSSAVRPGMMYDAADSILEQKLSQIDGVGQVSVGGSALPGVRVELNPTQMSNLGVGLEDVRTVLANANANRPKGELANNEKTWGLSTTDQLLKAEDYQPLIVRYTNGAAVQLSDIGLVRDSVENVRAAGMVDGKPAVLVIIFRQPGANIIDTVDRIYAAMPQLRASIPAAIDLTVVLDRTTTIRASVHDVEFTMMISAQQAHLGQPGQPLGIEPVGLRPAGQLPGMAGVHQLHGQPGGLQQVVPHAPVVTGRFHDDQLHAVREEPPCQCHHVRGPGRDLLYPRGPPPAVTSGRQPGAHVGLRFRDVDPGNPLVPEMIVLVLDELRGDLPRPRIAHRASSARYRVTPGGLPGDT